MEYENKTGQKTKTNNTCVSEKEERGDYLVSTWLSWSSMEQQVYVILLSWA